MCEALHPTIPGVRCVASGINHDPHYARGHHPSLRAFANEEGMIEWVNPHYRPPAPPLSSRAERTGRLLEMGRRVTPEHRVGAVARRDDPETSHEAARSLGDVRDSQREVLRLLVQHGPMTDEQIERRARESGSRQTVSGLRTRRRELVDGGLVGWAGRWSINKNGNRTRVWEPLPEAVGPK